MLAESLLQKTEKTLVKDLLEDARDFVKKYHDKEDFQVGDLIVWKDGMKNTKFPKYGEPILVLEMFPAERRECDGSAYSLEPDDMRCLEFKDKDDDDWYIYAHNSRRFTKYKG